MHKAKLKTKILSLLLAVSMVAGNIPETTITAIAAEAGNHAPKISADAPGMVELEVGDAYDVTQYFTDEDDDALTYTVTCDGEELGADLAAYDYEASEPGKHALAVEASDGIDQTCWNVAVIVTDTADVEHADENAADQNEDAIDVYDGENEDAVALEEDSEGISLDQKALSLTVGDGTRTITVTKSDTIGDLVWKSSDEKVAKVDGGVVTPVAMGTTTITATTVDGSFTEDCKVTVWGSCGSEAKWFCDGTTLTIEGSGSIDDSAAMKQPWKSYLRKITKVVLGSQITSIGKFSFAGCIALTVVEIPEDSKLESISTSAFNMTNKLTSVTLPGGLVSISDTNIANKEIHFRGTEAQWEKLGYTGKKNVYVLDANGEEALYNPNPYDGKCGANATWHYDKATGTLTISGTGAIADYSTAAPAPWSKLRADIQTVVVEDGITAIGNSAFAACTKLQTITLADSVTSIGESAFNGSDVFTEISLEKVTAVGKSAFSGCAGLKGVSLPNVVSIGEQAFANCTGLSSISLGSDDVEVESIGIRAFQNCSSLETAIFKNVKSIPQWAFQGTALIKVSFANVTEIGAQSFTNVTTLEEVSFGARTTTIGSRAFSGTGIKAVAIPSNVVFLEGSVFANCAALKKAEIAEGIREIPASLFYGDSSLESVALPTTLEKIGDYAFYNCTALTKVNYAGSDAQWAQITIGTNNDPLLNARGLVAVSGITLDKQELNLTVGEVSDPLVATVLPQDATDKTVTWQSSDTKVATVDNNGAVTAVSAGSAVITAVTKDGNFSAACSVTVELNEDAIDLTTFSFTLKSSTRDGTMFEFPDLQIERATKDTYRLNVPVYAVYDEAPGRTVSIEMSAPDDWDKDFTVTYTAWASAVDGGYCLGQKTAESKDGKAVVSQYYNDTAWYDTPELKYSDFIVKTGDNGHEYKITMSLYNDLSLLAVKPMIGESVGTPLTVSRDSTYAYSATLTRGTRYQILAYGGTGRSSAITKSKAYICEAGNKKASGEYTKYYYTPGDENQKDFVIKITNDDSSLNIAEQVYSLHFDIQDVPENVPSFNKYIVTLNGKTIELKKGEKLPSITQNDDLSIRVVFDNVDESAEYAWVKGATPSTQKPVGDNRDTLTVDTSSTSGMSYVFACTVKCNGQSVKSPLFMVQKVNALQFAPPVITAQPGSATYPLGKTASSLKIEATSSQGGRLRYQWYKNNTNSNKGGELIEGATASTYLPETSEVGTTWYYCEAWAYKGDIVGEKATSGCAEITVTKSILPFAGSGTVSDPFIISSEADLDAIRKEVADGNPFAGMYFQFGTDIILSNEWQPIGTTKDGSGDARNGTNMLPFAGILDGANHIVTVADGGKPLFNYVRNATVKNLKIQGTNIDGYGLVNCYTVDYGDDGDYWGTGVPETISIENCHILSGTNIKYSGFLGGYASGLNIVRFSNCTVAQNVTIGYGMADMMPDGLTHSTGALAGDFNGYVTNCSSAATVKGQDKVGGLIGAKGQSMGPCEIVDSQFTGTVVSNGCAGGVVGSGYSSGNSPCVTIEKCTVSGEITGKTSVGGILGKEGEIVQCWDNGIGGIRNNQFTGVIHASGKNVGGIIGYMCSINRYNRIENNYYTPNCGANCGIGFVKYVDTDCATHETESGAVYFDTSKELPGISGVDKKNLNRSDDPLGADKDKLCYSEKRTEAYVESIAVSGKYKTEYLAGEKFDTAGIIVTATWSNGDTTTPAISEVTFTGFDSTEPGTITITAQYKNSSTTFVLTIKPRSNKITVSVSIYGDNKHGASGGVHGLAMGGLSPWASEPNMEADTSETVWDVLKRVFSKHSMSFDASDKNQYNTIYIASINGLGEFDNGQNSGWMYTVNGVHPDVGVSAKYLHDGDVVIFHYTDDYTLEKHDVEGMTPAEVIRLIKAIPDKITLEAEETITAARAAYEKLAEVDRDQVINYQKLLDAEKKLSALKHDSANARNIHAVTGNYLKGLSDKTAPTVSSIGGDWLVLGLTRSGKDVPAGYFDNVAAYVKKNINASGQLDANKSTENSRVILALTAAGFDPRNVGGYNLLNGLSDMDFIKKQGLNGPIWALIALDSHNYSTPAGTVSNPTTREKLIETILNAQLADGGWAYSGTVADSDMTGMALQALAPYYKLKTNDKLTSAVDKAIAKLSTMQKDNGAYATTMGMGSGSTITSESTSQVVVALTALGIDPNTDERFVKNGFSAVDALLDYAVDGGFEHLKGQGMDGMATEQGYYALTSYIRMRDGKTTLYDMSDVTLKVGKVTDSGDNGNSGTTDDQAKKDQAAADKVEKLIDAIGTVTVNSETRIKKARNAYDRLTDAQKKLVSNYQDLKDAEKDLKKAKVSYVEDLIDSIGNVTLNSKTKINRARTAYDKLDKSLKDDVGNLSVLEAAEAAYKKLLDGSSTADDTAKKTTGTATGKAAGKSYGTATGKASAGTGSTGELTAIAGSVEELLDNITDDSIAGEILDAILAYEDLTTEEQAALGRDRQIEDLKKRVAELNQTDRTTGISVSGVDWNIQLVIGDVLDVETIANLKEQLQNCDMLSLWDISLEDVLTGEKYEPTGTVLVKIPLALLGDYSSYDGIAVAHYGEYGNVEYLNCTVMGDCLVFNTVEFSRYAVVGFNGAFDAEGLMTASVNADGTATPAEGMPWLPWALAGGCGAALLIALLMLAQKKQKSEVGS